MIAGQARLTKHTFKSNIATQSLALHPPSPTTITDIKQKSYLKIQVAYGSGSWRIRTADPLLVRQMLWTSWAKLPICKAWDCKGSYYFLISKLFHKFSQRVLSSFQKLDLVDLTRGLPQQFGLPPLVCIPCTWAPEQGLEPRTPWLTVMCSNRLSYSGICKEPLSFDCGAKVGIIF